MPRALRTPAAMLLAALASSTARAADVVAVLPLTDRILLVHLDEGHVVHHKLGEPRANEPVVASPPRRRPRLQARRLHPDVHG